jgi:DNA-directed RNA polymerase subunit H (RpoH/RPB5)
MEVLYEKYINIQKFITEYRQYKLHDQFIDFSTFKKTIQIEQYIRHICTDVKNDKLIYIYLFHDNSKYIKTTPNFKRLMDKLPEEPANVIIISKIELSIYINKSLLKYPHLKVYNYLHKYFAIEISQGPLCSIHSILSNTDVRNLCSRELIIHPLSLPSISINDPQNIWIGGELGQVIKIVSISEITGKTIRYRIVSPDSGKMINIHNLRKSIQDYDDAQDLEDNNNEVEKKILNPSEEKKEDTSEYVDDVSDDEISD